MNLINILYEPYVIIIFLSLLITSITYFILVNQKNKEKSKERNKDNKINISKILLYTFIISFIILVILKFIISYINVNQLLVQKGGVINPIEKLTIVADDVDFDIIDD